MIDTDKYEGHTPAPWRIGDEEIEDEGWADLLSGPWRVCGLTGLAKQDDPDAQLIVDAPLLLAEVKRLSALADALWDLIPSYLSTEATDVWNEYNGEEEE